MKDSFCTVVYKTGWIHSCRVRATGLLEIRVQFSNGAWKTVPTYRAAQMALNAASEL